MKVDDPRLFMTLVLGGWVIGVEFHRKTVFKSTYNPFFFLLVLFLCISHAFVDLRAETIVTIRSETRTLDTTNDVHSPFAELLRIPI